jgi:hypothetical protein
MQLHKRQAPPPVPKEYAGKWVVWNRDQTKIVASGRTFDEAKRAAARAGQTAVILGKIPPAESRFRLSHPFTYMVAVFISQMTP